MDGLELINKIKEIVLDKQGEDILLLDLQPLTPIADYFLICTATSKRQTEALSGAIEESLKKSDSLIPQHIEGNPDSGWILMDYNSVIVHILSPEMRQYYRLEDLWKNARIIVHIQ